MWLFKCACNDHVVNGQDNFVDVKQLLGIRRELTEVRNKVNSLVDALDSASLVDSHASTIAENGWLLISP